jgi:hypothetical protein
MVFDAHDRAFAFFKGTCTRGIYDNMKTAVETIFVGKERPTTGASCRCAATIWSTRRLHAGVGLGEGPGREPGRAGARALLHAAAAGQELRRAERLAARQVRRLCQGAPPSRVQPDQTIWEVFEEERPTWCPMPAASTASTRAGLGVEDLPGALRQQQILGAGERRRPAGRDPRLCRPDRHPPGRPMVGEHPAASAATRRSTIPGTTCRCWPASPAPCATARRSRTGCCRRHGAVRRKLKGLDDGDRQMVRSSQRC